MDQEENKSILCDCCKYFDNNKNFCFNEKNEEFYGTGKLVNQVECKYFTERNIIKEKRKLSKGSNIFSRRGQIESFWREQPFFYDKSKIFWLWDKENYKWILSDEVDFLNSIQELIGIETIDSTAKTELVEGFKQIGRKKHPKEIKKSWVQFKDKIYDVKTGDIFSATPEYFVTNPIPWEVGECEDTPTIDKLFSEWVEEKYIKTLYEIIAYNISTDKFMQRIIALCGGGSNGKGTFVKLIYKFLNEDNCVSSEIKELSENHFEAAVLYRKLLCVMGEVSYDDLKNTNQLKKLGGEDKISFQFKGKTPFTSDNSATCMCLTNSLPITPDKSLGFYRKWLIIDFPNQFKQITKNLINMIPDIEFSNLARKSIRILKELYDNPVFTNEGSFEERAARYEERANPIMQFVSKYCSEEAGENITLREFTNELNIWLKENHLRIMTAKQVGKVMRDEGFTVGARKLENGTSSVVILNLKIEKTIKVYQNYHKSKLKPHEETILKLSSFRSFDILSKNMEEIIDFLEENQVISDKNQLIHTCSDKFGISLDQVSDILNAISKVNSEAKE